MIKQLFKTKVLGASLLVFFFMLAVSGVNQLGAQSSMSTAANMPNPPLSNDDYISFKAEITDLAESTESNPAYSETEKAIRLNFYANVAKNVKNGYAIENAIDAAIQPTKKYAQGFKNPYAVDIIALAQETKNILL